MQQDQPPSIPVIEVSEVDIDLQENTFTWLASVDPEGKALIYTWELIDPQTTDVLMSLQNIQENQVTINNSDLSAILEAYLVNEDSVELMQRVTTSDTFTIVQSEPSTTVFAVTSNNVIEPTPIVVPDTSEPASGGGSVSIIFLLALCLIALCRQNNAQGRSRSFPSFIEDIHMRRHCGLL